MGLPDLNAKDRPSRGPAGPSSPPGPEYPPVPMDCTHGTKSRPRKASRHSRDETPPEDVPWVSRTWVRAWPGVERWAGDTGRLRQRVRFGRPDLPRRRAGHGLGGRALRVRTAGEDCPARWRPPSSCTFPSELGMKGRPTLDELAEFFVPWPMRNCTFSMARRWSTTGATSASTSWSRR